MSVKASLVNPVLWLTIVTCASGTTAPLGSVIVPKTVASWVCDHAHTENEANKMAHNRHPLQERRLVPTRPILIISTPDVFALQTRLHAEMFDFSETNR